MLNWTRSLACVGVVTLVTLTPAAAQTVPEGITKEAIDEGGKLFRGEGLCYACHGQQGKGMQGLGSDLADQEWLHSDGSVEGILETIVNGVSGDKSSVGVSMPAKGGSALNEEKLRAVAAYVWSLSSTKK
jgi:cbb3-type cytochrome c oxidase subunit III